MQNVDPFVLSCFLTLHSCKLCHTDMAVPTWTRHANIWQILKNIRDICATRHDFMIRVSVLHRLQVKIKKITKTNCTPKFCERHNNINGLILMWHLEAKVCHFEGIVWKETCNILKLTASNRLYSERENNMIREKG